MPRTMLLALTAVGVSLFVSTSSWAQEVQQSTSIVNRDVMNQISAFSYREGPESELLLTGTPLAPAASGKVEVEFQKGRSEVRSDVKELPEPASLGPYTTYVLWAVTPDGRATNLGTIPTSRGKGKLNTSFSGSQFALLVAAEPHFAVSAPSTNIVLFNLGKNVKGEETKITSLAERADYSNLAKIAIDEEWRPRSWLALVMRSRSRRLRAPTSTQPTSLQRHRPSSMPPRLRRRARRARSANRHRCSPARQRRRVRTPAAPAWQVKPPRTSRRARQPLRRPGRRGATRTLRGDGCRGRAQRPAQSTQCRAADARDGARTRIRDRRRAVRHRYRKPERRGPREHRKICRHRRVVSEAALRRRRVIRTARAARRRTRSCR